MQLPKTCQPHNWLNTTKLAELDKSLKGQVNPINSLEYQVIDGLFDDELLAYVAQSLELDTEWQQQQHTYSALNVEELDWVEAGLGQRFVQRDVWERPESNDSLAAEFLQFMRSAQFMSFLSAQFSVHLTDCNVGDPSLNTNYFRMAQTDFVNQHADQSPNREVCLLLYLNQGWKKQWGGELCFLGNSADQAIKIAPMFNRCIVFNPSSTGSEHWVAPLDVSCTADYRYSLTSWYWSE